MGRQRKVQNIRKRIGQTVIYGVTRYMKRNGLEGWMTRVWVETSESMASENEREGVATLRPVSGMIRGKVEKTGWTGWTGWTGLSKRTGWMNSVKGEQTSVSMAREGRSE